MKTIKGAFVGWLNWVAHILKYPVCTFGRMHV